MKVTSEQMEKCQIALSIEVEPHELEESRGAAYHRLVNKVSIPGFRKGKAPPAVLEQHVGHDVLLEEALEHLVPRLYREAVESQGLEPVAAPQIEVAQTQPVVFRAIVPLKPKVELGDYHNVRVKSQPIDIGEKEVEIALEEMRREKAVLQPVDRPVQFGDFVTLDVVARVGDRRLLDHKGVAYEVSQNSSLPLPGFADNLLGIEKTVEKVFTLNVPEKYNKNLAGKECICTVTVSEVKQMELPEFTDEWAQGIGCQNLALLREKTVQDLMDKAEERRSMELRRKAVDAVVEQSTVSYPPILEEREIDRLLEEETRRTGYEQLEDYLKGAGRTRERLVEELRPVAMRRVADVLVLEKVAEEEKIEIASLEVDNKVEEIVKGAGDKGKARELFTVPHIRESIEHSLRTERTVDMLVQIATQSQKRKGRRLSKGSGMD